MSITITEAAAEKIRQGLQQEGLARGGLRLGVRGGGCSGLSYVMRFEEEKKPGDRIFEEYGVQVFVDMKSYLFLKGHGTGLARVDDAAGLHLREPQCHPNLQLRPILRNLTAGAPSKPPRHH